LMMRCFIGADVVLALVQSMKTRLFGWWLPMGHVTACQKALDEP